MAQAECILCSIARGSSPSWIVDESEAALAILDINPATPGHTLVIPQQHAEDIWAVSPEDFVAVAELTHSVAAILDERLELDGLTPFQANRSAGWQDVFHLHIHLVPRYANDRLVRPWVSTPEGGDEIEAVHRTLTAGRQASS